MTTSNAVLLPGNVKPTKYDITLEPDFSTFTFNGRETIQIEILSPTTSITLNSIEIAIESCTITSVKRRGTGSTQHTIERRG